MMVVLIQERRFDALFFTRSGGMPSAHSALVCGLATAVALEDGLLSVTFAISAVLALVVMYDSAGVRQAVGKQAVTINRILRTTTSKESENDVNRYSTIQHEIKVLLGHTPFQVFWGAALGIGMAFLWLLMAGYSF